MADARITDLTALTGANTAPTDVLVLVDVSDTTMAATGTDKKITRQELQTYNAGTLTTDVKVLDLSATWNAAGVTFTGIKLDVTSTASAAASLLMDLQVGGTTKFKVSKAGVATFDTWEPIVGLSGYGFRYGGGGGSANGFTMSSGNQFWCLPITSSTVPINVVSGSGYSWVSSATDVEGGTIDLSIFRDAANTLAQRNGTNAQTFNHYGHYASATSYSRLAIKHAVTTLASVTGATVTATGLIPAKANVLGVNTKIMVALGTGSGTTGYAVGDGTDPNRWGDVVGTATTVSSDQTNATADPTGWFNAANDVVITAAGGNFDGTGSILIDVAYTMTEAD